MVWGNMKLLDGKKVANDIKHEIAIEVKKLLDLGFKKPHLAAILVGNNGASETYVNAKVKACKKVGFDSTLIRLSSSIEENDLLDKISDINNDNNICGFLLVLPSGLDYQSLNYKWFTERYSDFAYIDRIAISSKFRGLGIGKSLYLDLERSLDEYNMIACEFNIEPPNPISKSFHESLNYKNVGFQFTENNTKKVSLMVKNI